jgi:hypothetical protein
MHWLIFISCYTYNVNIWIKISTKYYEGRFQMNIPIFLISVLRKNKFPSTHSRLCPPLQCYLPSYANGWKQLRLVLLEHSGILAFINVCSCCLQLKTFAAEPLNFVGALHLFVSRIFI